MNQLKQIQAHTLRNGTDHISFLILKALDIHNIHYARALLDFHASPTTFLYNKLIQAHTSHGLPLQCVSLYASMRLRNCPPSTFSFTFLFAACASLRSTQHGIGLHTHFLKLGFAFDAHAFTSLIDMYAKHGLFASAHQLFDEIPKRDLPVWNAMVTGYARYGKLREAEYLFEKMPARNVISWTAMISGYSQNAMSKEAVEMFMSMWEEGNIKPNEVTIASVLPACANLGALELGKKIDQYARECGFLRNMFVANSLLEMYAKCGRIDYARCLFEEIGGLRNLCTWNVMIMALAIHGRWEEGLELFQDMLSGGTAPDDVTFIGVLLACIHGGLVDTGWKYFHVMEKEFSLSPKLEHYGCMVDLFGRAGLLKEAYNLIKSMPMKPDSVVWGALLGACSFHGNVELAEIAAGCLFELEPSNPGNYVILSNVYASAGRWDGVALLRMRMRGNLMKKEAGYSSIEVGGVIHKFLVEDRSHPWFDKIVALLDEITVRMKRLGHTPDIH